MSQLSTTPMQVPKALLDELPKPVQLKNGYSQGRFKTTYITQGIMEFVTADDMQEEYSQNLVEGGASPAFANLFAERILKSGEYEGSDS